MSVCAKFQLPSRVQRDSWSWSWNSRLGLSRPSIGLGLDRIFKSRPVLVLVSFEILFQDKSWSWSRLKFSFKTSLGIGLERQKIKTKSIPNRIIMRNQKMDFPPGWLVVKLMIMTFLVNSYMFFKTEVLPFVQYIFL